MEHDLIAAPVRLFGDFPGVGQMREHGKGQRKGKSKQRVGLSAVVAEIIDHDRETRPARRGSCGDGSGNRRNQMNRLRAPAIQHVIETLHAGRSGARDAPQVMKLGDAR